MIDSVVPACRFVRSHACPPASFADVRDGLRSSLSARCSRAGPLITAQQSTAQDQTQPTFRTEANYIRVDVYATTRDGMPVTDLRREDFELLEDRVPQTIDQFSPIEIRTGNAPPARSDPRTPEDSRQAATEPRARVFVPWWRRIESGLGGAEQRRSASRDSQVRPTAQRSGRCPIGVRRFKSCSLHSVFYQEQTHEQ